MSRVGVSATFAAALLVMSHAAPCVADTRDMHRRAHATLDSEDLRLEDIKMEIRFGREVAARILGREKLFEDDALTHYVNLVGQSVANNSQRSELEFHFAILESDDVNAYSTPGGYIFVTRAALKEMGDESELAAVLAHEIAHIQLKHIVNALHIRATETSGFASGLSVLFGGTSDAARAAFYQAVDKATEVLFEEGFRIQDELDADRVATSLLANSGYDATALHRYLERIETRAAPLPEGKHRTHPTSAARLQQLTDAVRDQGLADTEQLRNTARYQSYAQRF